MWEAIGFQVVSIAVDGTVYSWTEYVLFNPYRGFLYLSEYEGHWNVIEKLNRRPAIDDDASRPTATLDGTTYKHFQTATARTTFALGEFPWEVHVGDRVVSRDYVAPPYILSAEASDGETTWSRGTYTPSDRIRRAFGVETSWPSPVGVFANQPNPYLAGHRTILVSCALFLGALLIMLMGNVMTAGNRQVLNGRFRHESLPPDSAAAFVTDVFALDGRPSSVVVSFDTDADNNWVYFDLALIDEATGQSREATKQISYYAGVDSDGSWSEGSRSGRVRYASVPRGRYFIRVASQGGEPGRGPIEYTMSVRRDVPGYGFYGLALAGIIAPALLALIPGSSFEQRRLAESDYAPSSGGSDDDDDDDE